MTRVMNLFLTAAVCLLAGCAKPEIIDPQQPEAGQDASPGGEPVTVVVSLPELSDAGLTSSDAAPFKLVWGKDSGLLAVGFDKDGKMLSSSEFSVQTDETGKAVAKFDGKTIKGAATYIFYKKTPGLSSGEDGKMTMPYEDMAVAESGDLGVLENHMLLGSEPVAFADLSGEIIPLELQNSILRLNILSSYANLGEIRSIDWIGNDGSAEKKVLKLKYNGRTVVDGCRKALENLYFCFDPAEMSMAAGQKMTFRLFGSEGMDFSVSETLENGKEYEAGQIYEVNLSTDPEEQNALTHWNEPVADLVDIVFSPNGDARDISDAGRTIYSRMGQKLLVSKLESTGSYAALFSHQFASTAVDACYTFPDYSLREQMSDGYTLEAYVMCSADPTNSESKCFSSTKSGGTALLLRNKTFHFIYKDEARSWQFIDSGITPVKGQWYHLVGTFDPVAGKACCYVDGKGVEADATGHKIVYSSLGQNSYMTIGGNSSTGTAETPALNGTWAGGVALARIYNRPLTAEEVILVNGRLKKIYPEAPVDPENPETDGVKADMLDVVFSSDGYARDVSGSGMFIEHVEGTDQRAVFSPLYKRFISRFNHVPLSSPKGYYKVDYQANENFIRKLKDGHSIEVLFSAGQDMSKFDEAKILCSHEGGGTGMMTKGGAIAFLPNVNTVPSSRWCWAKSNIVPVPGRYYHAVGVWDKEAGKAILYVDGVKAGEGDAAGELNLPTSSARWFGIGVDSSPSVGTNAWNGDIVLARIYDQVLTADQVLALYDKVKVDQPEHPITEVEYLQSCVIMPGNVYHVYGKGFQEGDRLRFHMNNGQNIDLDAEFAAGELSVTIPQNMKTSEYELSILRGDKVITLGNLHMIITDKSDQVTQARTVAHRCYHDKVIPENSLQGFKEADKRGFWGAEIDVQLTTDNVVLVNHNSSYPSDPQHRKIWTHTYAELSDIKLPGGERLPKLEYLLEAMTKDVKNLTLVLEIKIDGGVPAGYTDRMLDACIGLVKKYGLEDRVVWISFNYDSICKGLVQRLPGCRVMSLTSKQPSTCKNDGIFGMDYSAATFNSNPRWIQEGHELGLKVNVWTVNNEATMKNFILRGVDFITTDQPEILQKLLKKPYITK